LARRFFTVGSSVFVRGKPIAKHSDNNILEQLVEAGFKKEEVEAADSILATRVTLYTEPEKIFYTCKISEADESAPTGGDSDDAEEDETATGVKIPKLGKANPKYVALRWSEGSFVEPKLEYDMSTKGPQKGQLKAARLQRDGFVDLAYREHLEHLIKEDLDSRGLEHELEAVVKSVVNVNYNSERGKNHEQGILFRNTFYKCRHRNNFWVSLIFYISYTKHWSETDYFYYPSTLNYFTSY
jgi:hypothetical protein